MKIVVFASGNGTNAENIFKYAGDHENAEVVAVICDQPNAGVLERAKKYDLPTHLIAFDRDQFSSFKETKKDQEQRIQQVLGELEFDWICLAGYMRILSSDFIDHYSCKDKGHSNILNIHPSMLPEFKGKRDAYLAAFESGVAESGVTVHFVSAEIDAGPILLQRSFPRETSDDLESFRSRGMQLEYKVYLEALELLTEKNPYREDNNQFVSWREK